MATNFTVGDKVRILNGYGFDNKTGVIIKDGGKQKLGFRKPGEGYNTFIQQWIVMLDDTGEAVSLVEGTLGKMT